MQPGGLGGKEPEGGNKEGGNTFLGERSPRAGTRRVTQRAGTRSEGGAVTFDVARLGSRGREQRNASEPVTALVNLAEGLDIQLGLRRVGGMGLVGSAGGGKGEHSGRVRSNGLGNEAPLGVQFGAES